MKMHVISAAIAIVVIVTSANANNVPPNPVENNQSMPTEPSAILPFNKINFPVSHMEDSQNSMAVTTSEATLVTSKSINTTATTTIDVMTNNTSTTTPINVPVQADNTTATAIIDGMAYNTSETTTSATSAGKKPTEQLAMTNHIAEEFVDNKHIIIQPTRQTGKNLCPDGYTITVNGDCTPKFPDK